MGKNQLKSFLFTLFLILSVRAGAAPSQEEVERWPLIKKASLEQKKGHWRTAIKLYKQAYEEDIARQTAVESAFECYAALDRAQDGISFLKKAATDYPFDLAIRLFLSDKLHEIGKDNEAVESLDYAERLPDPGFRALLKKGMIYKKRGDHASAINQLTQHIEKAKPTSHEPYLLRAQSYQALNQLEAAGRDIKKAHELRPFDRSVLVTYAEVLRGQARFSEAEGFAKKCTEVEPNASYCWELWGDASLAQKKDKAASDYWQNALKISPENHALRTKLGQLLVSSGYEDQADPHFARVLRTQPEHLPALKMWVPSLMRRQKYDVAAEALEHFNRKNPKDLWSSLEYAKLMSFIGSGERAAEIMKKSSSATNHDHAKAMHAFYLFKIGRHSRAVDQLQDIKDSGYAPFYNAGVVHFWAQKYEKAVEAWRQVSPEDPNWIRAELASVLAMERMGQVREAFEKLNALPSSAQAQADILRIKNYLGPLVERSPADAASGPKPLPTELSGLVKWEMPK